jgi:hypothetical protein
MTTTLTLTRYLHLPDRTIGVFNLPSGKEVYTLELPYKDNKRRVSCIPTGEYVVRPHMSPKFKKCFKVHSFVFDEICNEIEEYNFALETMRQGVRDDGERQGTLLEAIGDLKERRDLLLNEDNRARRTTEVKGRSDILIHAGNFPRDTTGCILVGLGLSKSNDLLESRSALQYLQEYAKTKDGFNLVIKNEE